MPPSTVSGIQEAGQGAEEEGRVVGMPLMHINGIGTTYRILKAGGGRAVTRVTVYIYIY